MASAGLGDTASTVPTSTSLLWWRLDRVAPRRRLAYLLTRNLGAPIMAVAALPLVGQPALPISCRTVQRF